MAGKSAFETAAAPEVPFGDSMLDNSDLGDTFTPTIHADNDEVHLRITKGEMHTKETTGNVSIHAVLEDMDDDHADDINVYIGIPNERTELKVANKMRLRRKEFYQCFGIDYSGPVDVERDLPGKDGYVIVSESDNPPFGRQNSIKSYIQPR